MHKTPTIMKYPLLFMLGLIITSFTIEIAPKVRAKIYVVDEANNIITGAKVTLYGTFNNYKIEKHPVASGKTSKKGFIEFTNLDEKVYYIHAIKGDLNNNGGNNQTDTLHAKGKNRFEIMID